MSGKHMLGFLFIALGLGFLFDMLGLFDFRQWWPVLVVLVGIYQLTKGRGGLISGVILIFIGGFILGKIHGIFPDNIGTYFWPFLLIVVGVLIVLSQGLKGRNPVENMDKVDYFTVFSGIDTRVESENFKGGSAVALFGGVELDLSNSNLAQEGGVLDLAAAFGGIDIKVPNDWKVEVTGVPIFGGWTDKTHYTPQPDGREKILAIKCLAIFGGVEIKN